jgi:hypothetical protein
MEVYGSLNYPPKAKVTRHTGHDAASLTRKASLSTGHVKEPDPLCARPVERLDRFGCRLQQDLAALSFEIGFSFQ